MTPMVVARRSFNLAQSLELSSTYLGPTSARSNIGPTAHRAQVLHEISMEVKPKAARRQLGGAE